VIDHFRPLVERFTPVPLPPLAFFGTGTALTNTTWNFGQATAGGSVTVEGADTNTVFTAKGALGVLGSGSVFLANLTGSALALTGGPGNNSFSLTNWAGTVSIDGKAGTDTLALTGPFSGTITALDPLTVVGSVANRPASSPAFLNGSLVLSGDTVVNVADGLTTQDLVINAGVTGTGRLLKQGAGTLLMNGTSTVPVVLGGGTLAGTGTVGGLTNVAGVASALSPGLPGLAGKLVVNGGLALGPDVTLVEQLNGTTPNSALFGFDQLDVRGLVRLTNPTLQASLGFVSAVGDTFPVLLDNGPFAVGGNFNGLGDLGILFLNGQKFQITYKGGRGNDVVLTHLDTFALFPNRTITPSVTEGSVATLRGDIVDPDPLDTFTLNIDWGDGSPVESHTFAPGTPNVTLTHRYLDNPAHGDTYTVALEWHDQHGGGNSGTLSVVVSNVPPTVSLTGPTQGVREQPLTFALSATDPSPVDQAAGFDYVIDWGDGSHVERVDATPGNGTGLTLEHAFGHAGTFLVRVTAIDKDGGVSAVATQVVAISAVALEADPLNSDQTMLVVGGTDGNDTIRLLAAPAGGIEVVINGASQGIFHPTGRLVVYGGDGNDDIAVAQEVTAQAWLYAGAGNDRLQAGGGSSVLIGGAGNDVLIGGSGRAVLIGGAGSDQLIGGAGEDLLIGGTTAFDANEAALAAILAEWSSGRDYATRVANLSGTGSGPRLNGDTLLTASGPGATVFDDGDRDVLSGGTGLDWFFAHLGRRDTDDIAGLQGGEIVTNV
jgi:Ca2+-binding RTX toxin-like protein